MDPNKKQEDPIIDEPGTQSMNNDTSSVSDNKASTPQNIYPTPSYHSYDPADDQNHIKTSEETNRRRIKPTKKIVIILAVITTLTIISFGTYLFLRSSKPAIIKTAQINRQISSPIGFVGDLEPKKEGKITFTINDEVYKANYFIEDKQLYIELLPNAKIINKFLIQLANKNRDEAEQIKPDSSEASLYTVGRYVKFSYASLYQLDTLTHYSPYDIFSLYLPLATGDEDLKNMAKSNESSHQKIVENISQTKCKPAAVALKNYISDNRLNTELFTPPKETIRQNQGETTFDLDSSKLELLMPHLRAYIDMCILDDSVNREINEKYYHDIIKRYENLPKISITSKNKDSSHELFIKIEPTKMNDDGSAQEAESISLSFEPNSKPSQPYEKQTTKNNQLSNRTVIYALAFEKCRVPPVVLSSLSRNYSFSLSDTFYIYPSPADGGYACSTQDDAVKNYSPADFITLDLGENRSLTFNKPGRENVFQKYHDISYHIETFFVKNKRFPSLEEILANKVEGLDEKLYANPDGKKIGQSDLSYELLPAGCNENCQDYKIRATIYVPQTNNTIVLYHSSFKTSGD